MSWKEIEVKDGGGMTLEELQAMTDRELDALVAEKVMGWKGIDRYLASWGPEGGLMQDDGQDPCYAAGLQPAVKSDYTTSRGRTYSHYEFVPFYSTDLNLAAQVEEKVIERVGYVCWYKTLTQRVFDIHTYESIRATARQRIIACLLAWEDGE